MPRLTEASRQRRREQIAAAAMRCFARQGFRDTTMADIIAESGLSAGSIYSHFESKADLMRMVASDVLEARVRGLIAPDALGGHPASPGRLFEAVVTSFFELESVGVLVQVWGETPNDPELAAFAEEKVHEIRGIFREAVRPWAHEQGDASDARLDAVTDALIACVQGFVVRCTLDAAVDPASLARTLATFLDRM